MSIYNRITDPVLRKEFEAVAIENKKFAFLFEEGVAEMDHGRRFILAMNKTPVRESTNFQIQTPDYALSPDNFAGLLLSISKESGPRPEKVNTICRVMTFNEHVFDIDKREFGEKWVKRLKEEPDLFPLFQKMTIIMSPGKNLPHMHFTTDKQLDKQKLRWKNGVLSHVKMGLKDNGIPNYEGVGEVKLDGQFCTIARWNPELEGNGMVIRHGDRFDLKEIPLEAIYRFINIAYEFDDKPYIDITNISADPLVVDLDEELDKDDDKKVGSKDQQAYIRYIARLVNDREDISSFLQSIGCTVSGDYFTRPGKTDGGISGAIGTDYKGFINFSTNFPGSGSHLYKATRTEGEFITPFAYYAVNIYGSNEKSAADGLAKRFGFQSFEDWMIEKKKKANKDKSYPYDEIGNAHRFVDMYGDDIISVDTLSSSTYYRWTGKVWEENRDCVKKRVFEMIDEHLTAEIDSRIQDLEKNTKAGTNKLVNEKIIKGLQAKRKQFRTNTHRNNVASLVTPKLKEKYSIFNPVFDRNGNPVNLLNLKNGIIDLNTFEMREHEKELYQTNMAGIAYDKDADCPQFERYMMEWMDHNSDLVQYAQILIGLTLAGPIEHKFFVGLFGEHDTGKTQIVSILRNILGDYYGSIAKSAICQSRYSGANENTPQIAKVADKRFVCTDEMSKSDRANISLIKSLSSGGDTIMVTQKGEVPRILKPNMTLWLMGNNKPWIEGADEATFKRLKLLPFDIQIPPDKQEPGLGERLFKEEGPGIFNWALEGLRLFREMGEVPSIDRIEEAYAEYKKDNDTVAYFYSECHTDPNAPTLSPTQLYRAYRRWCDDVGISKPQGSRSFSNSIIKLYEKEFGPDKARDRSGSSRYYIGKRMPDDHQVSDNNSSNVDELTW